MIFARLKEIWILNKREEVAVESLTVGPSCQVLLPLDQGEVRRRFLRDGEVSDQIVDTNVIPGHLRSDLPPFPHGGDTRRGLSSTMVAWRRCSAIRRSSQASRACLGVSYSTSESWRSFIGGELDRRGLRQAWPRAGGAPVRARRRCAAVFITDECGRAL